MINETLIFIRGRWEIAHKEENSATGKTMWIRRDMSWICNAGEEEATMPMPPKPKKEK